MRRSITFTFLKLFSLLALLLIILTVIIGIALWNFDLDNYTESLSASMSEALQQPVSIASSKLTFRDGLAIELQQISIGSDENFRATVPKISITLKIAPLLRGNIILKELRMVEPRLELLLKSSDSSPQGRSQQLMNILGIDTLSIYNASLNLRREGAEPPWDSVNIEQFNAVLRGQQSTNPGQLTVVGALPAHGANFSLTSNLTPLSSNNWIQEQVSGRLQLTHFSLEQTPELSGDKHLPQAFDLDINFDGVPAQGVPVMLQLSATSAEDPLVKLSARWTPGKSTLDIDTIEGQFFSIPFGGELHFSRDETSNHLYGRFVVSAFDLNTPELKYWQLPLLKEFTGGRLNHLQASFANSWTKSGPFGGLPPIGLAFNIEDLQWGDSALEQLPQLDGELLLNRDALEIRKGLIIAPTGDSINLSGRIDSLLSDPQFAITADGSLALEPLRQLLQPPSDWSFSGSIPLHGTLHGTAQESRLSLTAELSGAGIELASILHKKQGQAAALSLKAQQNLGKFTIEELALTLKDQRITVSGNVDMADSDTSLELSLSQLDIAKLGVYSPFLERRNFKGKIEAQMSGPAAELNTLAKISNGGTHLISIIGELNNVNGSVRLNKDSMSFDQLQASLGDSAFTIDGGIADWQRPQLRLDLSSEKVRARDLIFHDPDLTLYDLSGRLLIDSQGIRFTPVRVRLEEDTLVTVKGELKSFRTPQVLLDVQADTANVMNVIDLFSGPSKSTYSGKRITPFVRITTNVRTGTLNNLRLKNAEATITFSDGLLDISPVSFENGQGRCDGRVIYDHSDTDAPLKISGHTENIDAQVIYKDFFKKTGLISGTLDADFYLEGKPANSFWAQARGGIGVRVNDGVLNKFGSLSKVFSLLNVSQLFSLKLPDLKTQGMPYSLMEGSLLVTDGRIYTEDLKITSEAMNLSLVGSQGLTDDTLDFTLGVMPLRTVDKVISSIPIAGWLLAGDDKALVTAYFKIAGSNQNPQVSAIPIESLSESVIGIFKRTFKLPGKLVKDLGSLFKGDTKEQAAP